MITQRAWTVGQLAQAANLRIVRGDADAPVNDITDDSRQVQPGSLFIARRGSIVDGTQFALDAINRGAAAVVSRDARLDTGAAALLTPEQTQKTENDDALVTARLAEVFFDAPSQRLKIVGITGTNGKTTTAFLVQQLLNEASLRGGLMGTVFVDDGIERKPANLTTPSAIDISRTLARMVANGCTHLVMEVSSHALEQKRTDSIHFDVGVFTNLSGDHLDYHGTMDAYLEAKKILFDGLGAENVAIINGDDAASTKIVAHCSASIVRTTIGAVSPGGVLHREASAGSQTRASAMIEGMDASGTDVHFVGPFGEMRLHLPLIGRHNVSNALQAACAAFACGVDAQAIASSLRQAKAVPGRLEPVEVPGCSVRIFVDYAHTDAALENVLRAVRPIVPPTGRLVVVFGCGGDRDRSKRPRMAQVACQLADHIIITSDNPRTENPDAIVDEIMKGIEADHSDRVDRCVDRKEAIERAVHNAHDDDIIVVAGKGHEDYQIIGTTKHSFDDRIIARQALQRRARPGAGV